MAQGLFASLLIGTIIGTLGTQFGVEILVTVGNYAKAAVGPAICTVLPPKKEIKKPATIAV